MITKKDIVTMAQHVLKRSKGIPDKRLLHPGREWLVGLLAFSLVVIVGSVWAAKSFMFYWHADSATGGQKQNVPKYQQDWIETVLGEYDQKTADYEAIVEDVVSAPVVVPTVTNDTASTAVVTEEIVEEEVGGVLQFE